MLPRAVALTVAFSAAVCLADEPPNAVAGFRAGVDYELIQPPWPRSSPTGRTEVIEVFQYGCGACAAFEPYFESWTEAAPDHIDVIRLPAVWNALGELHARAFYTAELLGVLERTHAPFFRSIHVDGNRLDTEEKLREFFIRHGVDANAFDETFRSFAVHSKVERAKELVTTRYRVTETPSIVVGGVYLARGKLAGSYERWLEIVESLAEGGGVADHNRSTGQ